MTRLRWIVALAVLALVTGCGSAGTAMRSPTPAAHTAGAASPAQNASSSATGHADAQLFAYGMASDSEASISALLSSVAGPVMHSYIRLQALEAAAYAAEGQAGQPGTVTRILGGFQICFGTQGCQSFTGFRSDATGHITDLAVDGQLISGRLAVGSDRTGSGLAISSVAAYLPTSTGMVTVVFEVRNIGHSVVGQVNPAFLPVLVTSDGHQSSYDSANSLIPGPLQPAESVAVVAVFDTRTITGQFSLRTNDQIEQVLVTSDLRKPPQP